MTLKQTKARGFTIVELLIVIVVIAILAAITIVAYNGVQTRARTSAAQAAGNTLQKKAEAANAIASAYPAAVGDFSAQTDSNLSGSGITLAAAAAGTATLVYQKCSTPASTNEARVGYYNSQTSATVYVLLGGTACTAWATALTGGPY